VRAIHVIDESAPTTANEPSRRRSRRHNLVADTVREQVSAHIALNPGVHVCTEVLTGTPGIRLTAAASGSELLILGTDDRRDRTSLTSGITRSAILHNATCPVLLV
jgi:nucleotide-binding universal stress UspA family protein